GDFVGWAPLGPDTDTPYDDVPGGVFTFVPTQSLAQPSAASTASFMRSVPVSSGELLPIEGVASYRGVSWNAGPDLKAVLGQGAAERLRLDERDGAGLSRVPDRSPIRDARELDRVVLERMTASAWRAGQREFAAARARRGGVAPNGNGVAPSVNGMPRVETRREPVRPDTSAAPDSVRRARRGGGN
ncbi:MAG: hypothetical protein K8R56_08250, partial [Candidatus Eisenbacteria bacterium]|nr:hypothetical protein [Candidatus Eisenbacteria bacterium]